ncbi:MAG: AmmeMemoRadiSam system protein B [Bacteroidota bacterium]|nr:AmmeMemoRadiSam system protein B [Bacteroidota bacterium]
MKKIRKPAVAGQFYSDDKNALNDALQSYFENAKSKKLTRPAKAVIAPHAGYVFSGQIAADAIVQIDAKKIKRVFVIGSSHHAHFDGVSVYAGDAYDTPLGLVNIDKHVTEKLLTGHDFIDFVPMAHQDEHCIEVEIPFIKHYLPDAQIVPLLIGSYSAGISDELAKAIEPWKNDPETAFVVSTDLSHFPDYETARKVDSETVQAIVSGKPDTLISTMEDHKNKGISSLATDICGWTSALTIMKLFDNSDIEWKKISTANSGDAVFGDHSRVVGYAAIAGLMKESNEENFSLSDNEKQFLLGLARKSIDASFHPGDVVLPEKDDDVPEKLTTQCGAFVTLHKNGKLRGCIGNFGDDRPLWKMVKEMAVAAAFHDTRFSPLLENELSDIEIEISVLTPLRPMKDISELKLGKHGIYIKHDFASGTFLPQVATDTGWNKEEFLGHCARDKAGMTWDGWKDADVYLYEAIVFK